MSKRFPIPEFDRDQYKNRPWKPPGLLPSSEQQRLAAAALRGDAGAFGCYPVSADPAFFERFRLRGEHLHVLMCALPTKPVRMVGRSWAWYIQRALVVDSMDATGAKVIAEWKTPRPMNTRLGPEGGIMLPGGIVYAVSARQYADYWITNRTLVDSDGPVGGNGFSIISATDDDNNDFHGCNLSFNWS